MAGAGKQISQPAAVKKAKRKHAEQPQVKQKATAEQVQTNKKDIDDLFNTAKQKKAKVAEAAKQAQAAESIASKKHARGGDKAGGKESNQRLVGNKDDLFGHEAEIARRRTEEGFAVYSEEELGLNKKGGDTDKCPFDCTCCY